MKRTIITIIILTFSLFIIGCQEETSVINNTNPSNSAARDLDEVKEPIFFYSNGCGHCQKVKEYIAENNIKNAVSYREVEAFATQENLDLFNEKSAACGIAENERGVPLVFENGECYFGQFEAIDFFKKKAGL
ncbi:MAG: glutaredoxin domain-containing protein [Patescibacteria group bacterium]